MIETLTVVRDQGRLLIQDPRRRRFGYLFVPVRRSYLFVMPGLLLAAGLLGFAIRTDFMMVFDAAVVSLISIYLAWDLLGRAGPLRMSTVFAFTLGMAYGIGTLNTWYTLPRGGETLGQFLNISTPDLTQAMACILISIGLMLAVGELFEKPIFGEEFRLDFDNRSILIVTLGTLFRFGTIATGHAVVFSSQTNITEGSVGALAQLSLDVEAPLLAIAFCMALNAGTRWKRWYLYALTVMLFAFEFPNGRRAMIYGMILLLLATRLGRFRIPLSPVKKIAGLIVVGGVLYISTLGFYYFRIASSTLIRPTIAQRIGAVVTLIETRKQSSVDKEFSSNVERRTFILSFVGELVGYTNSMPGGHGQDIGSLFELAIPSVLYPDKDSYFTEESLANLLFGAHYGDQPNSVFTAGLVDFGMFGLFVYPLLFIFIFRYFLEFVSEAMPSFSACFVVLVVLSVVLEPEVSLNTYFIAVREGILVGCGVWVLESLPKLQLTPRSRV